MRLLRGDDAWDHDIVENRSPDNPGQSNDSDRKGEKERLKNSRRRRKSVQQQKGRPVLRSGFRDKKSTARRFVWCDRSGAPNLRLVQFPLHYFSAAFPLTKTKTAHMQTSPRSIANDIGLFPRIFALVRGKDRPDALRFRYSCSPRVCAYFSRRDRRVPFRPCCHAALISGAVISQSGRHFRSRPQVPTQIFHSRPAEEPKIAVVNLVNDQAGLEHDRVRNHRIVPRIGILRDIELLLNDAARDPKEMANAHLRQSGIH